VLTVKIKEKIASKHVHMSRLETQLFLMLSHLQTAAKPTYNFFSRKNNKRIHHAKHKVFPFVRLFLVGCSFLYPSWWMDVGGRGRMYI